MTTATSPRLLATASTTASALGLLVLVRRLIIDILNVVVFQRIFGCIILIVVYLLSLIIVCVTTSAATATSWASSLALIILILTASTSALRSTVSVLLIIVVPLASTTSASVIILSDVGLLDRGAIRINLLLDILFVSLHIRSCVFIFLVSVNDVNSTYNSTFKHDFDTLMVLCRVCQVFFNYSTSRFECLSSRLLVLFLDYSDISADLDIASDCVVQADCNFFVLRMLTSLIARVHFLFYSS